MAYDQGLAARVREVIGGQPGLTEKKMFGGLAFLLNGNMACGVRGEDLMVRLAALTNSTEQVARAQLEHAGLIGSFDLVLSADTVRRLKPAPEPYLMAAERLGVAIGEVRLVAAQAWDIAGAARAGCAAAFVARPGKVLDPLVERPEIIGADLAEVADAILVIDHGDERP